MNSSLRPIISLPSLLLVLCFGTNYSYNVLILGERRDRPLRVIVLLYRIRLRETGSIFESSSLICQDFNFRCAAFHTSTDPDLK
jgi:hypothetical protein